MPVTRSKAAAEKSTLGVDEDFSALPSTDTLEPARPAIRVTANPTSIELSATEPHKSTTMPSTTEAEPTCYALAEPMHTPEPRTRARSIRSQRSNVSAAARIKQAEFEAEERLAEIRRQDLNIQTKLIKMKLAADIAAIHEETDRESTVAEETENRVTDWLARGEIRAADATDSDHMKARYQAVRETTDEPQHRLNRGVKFDSTQRPRSPTPTRPRERGFEHLADVLEKIALRRPPSRQSTDLPVFSGALEEWLPFKATMEESTKLHRFSPTENIARLRTCLRGEARQTVSALLYTATDPSVIMRTLEQCYGRPEMIIDNALEDIKKLPRLGTSASELNSFAIKLQNIVTTISCLDDRGYLQNPMLTRQVTDKLSPHIKSKWCDYAEDFAKPSEIEIVTLSRFLMREADRAMRHAYTTPAQRNVVTPRPQVQQPRVNDCKSKVVYATTEDKKTECFCCGADHTTTECKKLKAMPVEQSWEWAKETQICFRCLDSKHRRFRCKKKLCGVQECRRPHHALLHAESPDAEEPTPVEESVVSASTHETAERNKVLLKVCPIRVKGQNGTEIDTFALLDEGSTITLIDEELAAMIGAQGPRRALHIIGVTSSNREPKSQLISMEVQGLDQKKYQPIRARTVENLKLARQSVEADLLRQPHLRRLNPEHVCYAHAKPSILIGADNSHLIVTRKLLTGRENQPAASLTRLGWFIHGSTPVNISSRTEMVLHMTSQDEQSEQDSNLTELVKAHYDIDML